MKTKKFFPTLTLMTLITFVIVMLPSFVKSQANACKYLETGLISVPKVKTGSVTYKMTADYFNRDIEGHFLNKNRVSGTCTIDLSNGKATWNDCSVANSNLQDASFPEGEKLTYMEGFTYVPGYQLAEASAFSGWPDNSFYAKNLVWDMLAFQAFGLVYLDSLPLGKRIVPHSINGTVGLAGQGTFENRNSTVRWMGVTTLNNTPCALIEYRQIDGKLSVDVPSMKMKGRSNYWGTIWVSLTNRQIEYAEMTEDVNMNIIFQGQQQGQWFNTLREIIVEKINR
jgi:hypothetical protein